MKQPVLSVDGLQTDPNPHSRTTPGGLLTADNVVIRRTGVASPRPGFKDAGASLNMSGVRRLIPFDDTYLAFGSGSGGANLQWADGTDVYEQDGSTNVGFATRAVHAAEMRGNLYVTANDCVRKLEGSGDASAVPAGLPRPLITASQSAGGTAVATAKKVAYRAVLRREDGNGLVVRSAPSARAIYENDSGSTQDISITLTLPLQDYVIAGDVVEVYRSAAVDSSGTPSDELFYVSEYEITSSDLTPSLGRTLLTGFDTYTDDELGAALYTNPTREGIIRANLRPPECASIEVFQRSMFYGRVRRPHTLRLTWDEGGDQSGNASGIGQRTYTGTRTNASNQITGLSSTTGLKAGMLLATTPESWASEPPVIQSISGTTLTMTTTWSGSTDGAPVSLTFADSIRIKAGGGEDQFYDADTVYRAAADILNGGAAVEPQSSVVIAYPVGDAIEVVGTSGNDGNRRTLVIESICDVSSNGSFQVYATHGDEYDPELPEPYTDNTSGTLTTSGEPSVQDNWPHAVFWSKRDQPEHVTLGSYFQIGGEKSAIMNMKATREGLYIFKEDGIYRLSGHGELSGFRVDEHDLSHKAISHDCYAVFDDTIYTVTSRGFVAVSASGVRLLSSPFIGDLMELDLRELINQSASDFYGTWAAPNPKAQEIVFGLGDSSDQGVSGSVFVYSAKTQTWVRWFPDSNTYSHMIYDDSQGLLLLSDDASSTVRIERPYSEDSITFADLEEAETISSVDGTELTLASAPSAFNVEVGDLVVSVDSGPVGIVTGVTSTTVFDVDKTGFSAVGVTIYKRFQSCVEWTPKTAGGPGMLKRFRDWLLHFDNLYGVYNWDGAMRSERSNTESSRTYTESSLVLADTGPKERRVVVHRNHACSSQLTPKVCIAQADSRWELSGLTIGADKTSEVVVR